MRWLLGFIPFPTSHRTFHWATLQDDCSRYRGISGHNLPWPWPLADVILCESTDWAGCQIFGTNTKLFERRFSFLVPSSSFVVWIVVQQVRTTGEEAKQRERERGKQEKVIRLFAIQSINTKKKAKAKAKATRLELTSLRLFPSPLGRIRKYLAQRIERRFLNSAQMTLHTETNSSHLREKAKKERKEKSLSLPNHHKHCPPRVHSRVQQHVPHLQFVCLCVHSVGNCSTSNEQNLSVHT